MSKKDSSFQKVFMSFMYRGKEIFKPLNTGWIDDRVCVVREWVANVFFYRKNGTTIMIDAGYNYERRIFETFSSPIWIRTISVRWKRIVRAFLEKRRFILEKKKINI